MLDGHGLMTIAKDWNRPGVPGATQQPWTAKTLRLLREEGVSYQCLKT